MSHIAAVTEVCIPMDSIGLADLEAAAAILGGRLIRGQKTYRWYGKWLNDYHAPEAAVSQGYDPKTFGKCEHAIVFDGCSYDVGVVKRADGKGWTLIYDNYCGGGGLEAKVKPGLTKLIDEYYAEAGTRIYRAKGYNVQKTYVDGGIDLKVKPKAKLTARSSLGGKSSKSGGGFGKSTL